MNAGDQGSPDSAGLFIDAEIMRARLEMLIAEAEPVLVLWLGRLVWEGLVSRDHAHINPAVQSQNHIQNGMTQ